MKKRTIKFVFVVLLFIVMSVVKSQRLCSARRNSLKKRLADDHRNDPRIQKDSVVEIERDKEQQKVNYKNNASLNDHLFGVMLIDIGLVCNS